MRGTDAPHPLAIQPPGTGGLVEGILVFHRPGPAPGAVSLVVVLSTGGRGLRPALGATAAAPRAQGTLQAVVGCGDSDSRGHGRPLGGRGGWWASRCCVAEVVWRRQVDPAAWWLWHEGWWGAGICKGDRSVTPPMLPWGSDTPFPHQHLPMPTLSILDHVPPQPSLPMLSWHSRTLQAPQTLL